jgi:hypothetical protein
MILETVFSIVLTLSAFGMISYWLGSKKAVFLPAGPLLVYLLCVHWKLELFFAVLLHAALSWVAIKVFWKVNKFVEAQEAKMKKLD